MSRKQYNEAARILREADYLSREARERLIADLVTLFADDTRRFSPSRFRSACEPTHGFDFTGNGVGPSYLGGEILARLALDRRDERTSLAIVEPGRKLFWRCLRTRYPARGPSETRARGLPVAPRLGTEPVTATVDHADIRGLVTTLLVSVAAPASLSGRGSEPRNAIEDCADTGAAPPPMARDRKRRLSPPWCSGPAAGRRGRVTIAGGGYQGMAQAINVALCARARCVIDA
jgi:hypothetical protein